MIDALVELIHTAMTSPWLYPALFGFSAVDGFLPMVPSESLVISAGVFSASGQPSLALVILFSAAGAFVGDHVSYLIGRRAGSALLAKLPVDSRRRKPFTWATRTLDTRGGLVLVVCRYIPGFRTATTITMGAIGYPLARFAFFDAIAAVSWAVYSALIGLLGGHAFEKDPIKGVAFGLGLALAVTAAVEGIRYLRSRGQRADQPELAENRSAPRP